MRALAALAAAAVAFLLFVGAEAATPATAKRSPAAVYRALGTTPFAPATVAGRFSSARRSVTSPSPTARSHHAIGTIRVTFRHGQGTIDYTVFRSRTDARNTWSDDVTAGTANLNFKSRLHVYGLTSPSVLYLGSCASADCTSMTSSASIVTGFVTIDVTVTVLSQESYYDEPMTIGLARAANAHLLRLS